MLFCEPFVKPAGVHTTDLMLSNEALQIVSLFS